MDALERCGHCDNCTRPLGDVDQKDVTVEAWQILKIVDSVKRQGGRLTHNGLGDLARGMGGGAFDVGSGKGKGKTKEKQTLNLDEIAGGKVGLSRDVGTRCMMLCTVSDLLVLFVLSGNADATGGPTS